MSRRLGPCLVAIAARGADPTDALEPDPLVAPQLAPPGAYGVEASPMVVSRPFTLRLTGAAPGQRAYLFRAPRVEPAGCCPALIAPDCLDLPHAQAVHQLRAVADAAGVVRFAVTLPSTLGAAQVAWQGVSSTAGGRGSTSPAILRPVHPLEDTDPRSDRAAW